MTKLIATYLQDHHAGAVAGLQAFQRVAEQHADPRVREVAAEIADQVKDEQALLEDMLERVGGSPSSMKDAAAWTGEKLSRLKPNERAVRRSPLSDLIEIEALVLAVHGKLLMWQALHVLGDDRLDHELLQKLAEQAAAQETALSELRLTQVPKLHQE